MPDGGRAPGLSLPTLSAGGSIRALPCRSSEALPRQWAHQSGNPCLCPLGFPAFPPVLGAALCVRAGPGLRGGLSFGTRCFVPVGVLCTSSAHLLRPPFLSLPAQSPPGQSVAPPSPITEPQASTLPSQNLGNRDHFTDWQTDVCSSLRNIYQDFPSTKH